MIQKLTAEYTSKRFEVSIWEFMCIAALLIEAQVSLDGKMGKWNVGPAHIEVLFDSEMEGNSYTWCYNMGVFWGQYTKWRKLAPAR